MSFENDTYKFVVADSQFLVVKALETLIGEDDRFELAGVVDSQNELLSLIKELDKALIITDPANINYSSLEVLCTLIANYPRCSILVLTNSLSKVEFADLTKCGIKNIIYKSADKDEIVAAIEASLKGKKYFGGDLLDLLLDMNDTKQEEKVLLTASEIEIVKLISTGLTTKEIAMRRHISIHTVNTHRKNIFKKLHVSNVSELLIYAIKAGFIDNVEYQI